MTDEIYEDLMIHVRHPGAEEERITVVKCNFQYDFARINQAFGMRGVYLASFGSIEEAYQYIEHNSSN